MCRVVDQALQTIGVQNPHMPLLDFYSAIFHKL
jgi:hypothetical protein